MNIILYLKIIITITLFIFILSLYIWLRKDIKKNNLCKQKYGLFNLNQYINSQKDFLINKKYTNKTKLPKKQNIYKLKYINYFPFIDK